MCTTQQLYYTLVLHTNEFADSFLMRVASKMRVLEPKSFSKIPIKSESLLMKTRCCAICLHFVIIDIIGIYESEEVNSSEIENTLRPDADSMNLFFLARFNGTETKQKFVLRIHLCLFSGMRFNFRTFFSAKFHIIFVRPLFL